MGADLVTALIGAVIAGAAGLLLGKLNAFKKKKGRSPLWLGALLFAVVLIGLLYFEERPDETGQTDGGGKPVAGTTISAPYVRAEGEMLVHYINVGQGASQLLVGPTGKTMLIDAGNNDKEEMIVAYLQRAGIKKIDILVGTHPDADHIGGLDAVIDHFDIGQFYMPKVQSNTKTYEDVLLAAKKKGIKVDSAKADVNLKWDSGATARIVAPIGDYSDTNEMSAVIRVAYGETSFLLTGDAESKSETDLVASGTNLKADVLLIGHHGSNSSTSDPFLERVGPKYAVIQSGKNNYGHPTPEILAKLAGKNITVLRNDTSGNIVFVSNGKSLDIKLDPWEYIKGKAK
ncbi:MBL fold metallo-hydrolase [Paenibacillus ginsengarvi]|uniref:MBL fold metallo-hydrolase n=2 Tax=Paenibacillus ginsengarvi TaxID=400777 RepID=A0A3B0B6C7_9BACL|nr:MBL fold metallo-hydrolase [Paenibacillus ginsengarvi]